MKLLLHICCAPCAVAIVEKFNNTSDTLLGGFFYNPNIHPEEEYKKRKDALAIMSGEYNLPVIYKDSDMLEYWRNSLDEDKLIRCRMCYSIRLNEAAKTAKDNSYDAFTTSLLISPYQNHDLIKLLAEKAADKYGISFYYEDFRNLYRRGREISRGKHYYMQKYCGCFYSYSESDHPKSRYIILNRIFERIL